MPKLRRVEQLSGLELDQLLAMPLDQLAAAAGRVGVQLGAQQPRELRALIQQTIRERFAVEAAGWYEQTLEGIRTRAVQGDDEPQR